MCKTTRRFIECAKHGKMLSNGADVCMTCLKANAELHAAYTATARALHQRINADKCATPFPQRKAWPEWVAADAASEAFFAAVPRLAIRTVTHERKPEHKAERCGGACLSGKRLCSCVCGGFCHGGGECRCGTPEHTAFLAAAGIA